MDVEDVDADGVESGTGCVVFRSVDHNMFVKKQKCLGDRKSRPEEELGYGLYRMLIGICAWWLPRN